MDEKKKTVDKKLAIISVWRKYVTPQTVMAIPFVTLGSWCIIAPSSMLKLYIDKSVIHTLSQFLCPNALGHKQCFVRHS